MPCTEMPDAMPDARCTSLGSRQLRLGSPVGQARDWQGGFRGGLFSHVTSVRLLISKIKSAQAQWNQRSSHQAIVDDFVSLALPAVEVRTPVPNFPKM